MVTSVKELRDRLREFLADAGKEQEFRDWFALALRDSHKSGADVESLAHEIMWAFLDRKRGVYSGQQLADELQRLTVTQEQWVADPRTLVSTDALVKPQAAERAFVVGTSQVEIGPALVYGTAS